MRRGLTLLELLVAAILMASVFAAVARTFAATIDYGERRREARQGRDRAELLEGKVRELFAAAFVNSDAADTASYFIAADGGDGLAAQVTFTALGIHLPRTVVESTDDFETLNERVGPQGGAVEISIGTTPIGTPSDPNGLFLREQRPADGDVTQGGFESRISADVTSAGFEFWDGTVWTPSWDTQTGQRRIPAAVRMTYRLSGEDADRIVVFRVPGSDVTALNPLTEEAGI